MSDLLEARSERSARVLTLVLLWISRTLSALLVASPIVFAVQATGLVSGPERDLPLYRPGAVTLLELLRLGAPELGAAWKLCALLLVLSSLFGLLSLGTGLVVLREKTALFLGKNLLLAARRWPQFVGLSLIAVLAYAALLLACSLLSGAIGGALSHADERVQTLAPFALGLLGLAAALVIAAVHDLSRAVVTETGVGARTALLGALTLLRGRPAAVLLGAYPNAAAAVCAWLVAAAVLTRIDLTSSSAIALAFVVHQVAIVFGLAFRVRWLELALALAAELDSARE